MVFAPESLGPLLGHRFDAVIDVRSPAEHAEDHLPGAINLPVLNDDERARVGLVYVQQSRHRARLMGAALVARNAAQHLEGALADRPPGFRPLVYCWRGGQRSGSFALILRQIGWPAETLDGGYRRYRRLVWEQLYGTPWPGRVVVLDGNTGTAKTALLELVAGAGVQVIDLEGLARHRGSLFGARPGGQPSQKAFETALAARLAAFDPARPLLVEAESARIGRLILPPALWHAMQPAPRIEVSAPRPARAAFVARSYGDLTSDPSALGAALARLRPFHGAQSVAAWQALASEGRFVDLAEALMEFHYDPRYARSRARTGAAVLARVDMPGLGAADLAQAASAIVRLVEGLGGDGAG